MVRSRLDISWRVQAWQTRSSSSSFKSGELVEHMDHDASGVNTSESKGQRLLSQSSTRELAVQ